MFLFKHFVWCQLFLRGCQTVSPGSSYSRVYVAGDGSRARQVLYSWATVPSLSPASWRVWLWGALRRTPWFRPKRFTQWALHHLLATCAHEDAQIPELAKSVRSKYIWWYLKLKIRKEKDSDTHCSRLSCFQLPLCPSQQYSLDSKGPWAVRQTNGKRSL